PRGKTLSDVLPPPVLEHLQAFLAVRNAKLEPPLDRMKPTMLMVQVLVFDHMKQFSGATPLDHLLSRMAKDADKEIGALETGAEQIAAFELGEADDAAMLDDTIAQVETRRLQGRDLVDEMVRAYISGRQDGLSDGFWPRDKDLAARFEKQ